MSGRAPDSRRPRRAGLRGAPLPCSLLLAASAHTRVHGRSATQRPSRVPSAASVPATRVPCASSEPALPSAPPRAPALLSAPPPTSRTEANCSAELGSAHSAAAVAALASSPSRLLDIAPRLPQPLPQHTLPPALPCSAASAVPLATYVGFVAASSPVSSDANAAAAAAAGGSGERGGASVVRRTTAAQ